MCLNFSSKNFTNNSVTLVHLTKLDTGNYGCNASSVNGYVYKDVFINVLDLSPDIITPPQPNLRTVLLELLFYACFSLVVA